ncbi:MAG: class II aldolase/adducin family protein [Oscillospiraceae bacterium]|nr:class II aldolase/adducin family protein [Oscillospiraceae bacterium]
MHPIDHLVSMSNRYGGNADYVLAGGGNTSYKDEQHLYVKASGTALADITADGFVKMERAALDRIFAREYPQDAQAREAAVLQDMLGARCPGEERKRPSVEALLHHILPWAYVLHVHPAMVNGMTCGKNGAEACARLFPGAAWIPQIMPGYILAREARSRVQADTRLLFLENHGVFVGGESVAEIDDAVARMDAALDAVIARRPDFSPCELPSVPEIAMGGPCVFHTNREIMRAVSSREQFARVSPAFTPDHMVYCNDEALFLESEGELAAQAADYRARNGKPPKIIGLKDTGFYACGGSGQEADIAAAVFLDALKVSVYGESFSGARPMCDALVREINQWEVERYRKSVSFGGGA